MQNALFAEHALLPEGWRENVRLDFDANGLIASVISGAAALPGDARAAIAVPGLGNLHCHAFQRAMAGLAECASPGGQDSFWSWRETMYRLAQRIDPKMLNAVAAMAYMEMLKSGFTAVGEFHYLHHGPGGTPYDDPAEMSTQIINAAEATGMGLTLLPVIYARSGFDGGALEAHQCRFGFTLDGYARLLDDLRSRWPGLRLGIAPHSLRAVSADDLRALLAAFTQGPVHIHAAEQLREVEDCRAALGAPPVRWLLDEAGVDARWCLVHATRMDPGEVGDLASSGAVAGLCPITEANLGDGLFAALEYQRAGGHFGIGSDSCVRIDLAGELRLLDYGQRLQSGTRTPLAPPGRSSAAALFTAALAGGAQALGYDGAALAAGRRADVVTLDARHPALAARRYDAWLDAWFYAATSNPVKDVYVGGCRIIDAGHHQDEEGITADFCKALGRLMEG